MSLARTIGRNVCFNWLDNGVRIVVTFFLTPYIFHALGDARFGLWTLIIGVVGYYGLINLGFQSSLNQYIARYAALKDYSALQRLVSTAWFLLAGCASILLAATPVVAWLTPYIFDIPADMTSETRWCLLIVGATTAISFLFFPFSSVLPALQRFDLSSSIGLVGRLVFAGATIVALRISATLGAVSLAIAFHAAIDYSVRSYAALRILPQLRISHRLVNRKSLSEFLHFGFWNAVSEWFARLSTFSGPMIIGMFLDVAAIAPFAIAVQLARQIGDILGCAGSTFFPAMTELDARGDARRMRDLYLAGSKLLLLLAVPASIVAVLCAEDFLTLWLGEKFVRANQFASPTLLFYVVMAGWFFRISQSIGGQFLLGTRRLKTAVKLEVPTSLAEIILPLLLVRPFGLLGFAVGTALPRVVAGSVIQPIVINRLLGVRWGDYLLSVWLRPVLVGIALACLIFVSQDLLPVSNWSGLLVQGAVAAALAGALILLIGLTSNERKRFVYRPASRLVAALSVNGACGATENLPDRKPAEPATNGIAGAGKVAQRNEPEF